MEVITIDLRLIHASGMGTYLRNLVPLVINYLPSNFYYHFLGKIEELSKYSWIQDKRINLIAHDAPIYSLKEQFQTWRKIPKNTTLFWSPHFNVPIFYRGKLLVTVYDLFHLSMPKLVGGFHKQLYAKFMLRRVYKKANAILTISHFSKNEFTRLLGDPEEKIVPLHLGIDKFWALPQSETSPPYHKPFILYVGNVKPHKNLKVLVEAYNNIKDKLTYDLIIVGKKEGFITGDKNIGEYVKQLGDRVQFTGFIDDETLKKYYSHAVFFVFPSLYEGFGLPPLEAMSCGCPVIASKAASIPEICEDAALYFSPEDSMALAEIMLKLAQDKNLRELLKEKGFEHVKRFKWEDCCLKTCQVIERILENKKE